MGFREYSETLQEEIQDWENRFNELYDRLVDIQNELDNTTSECEFVEAAIKISSRTLKEFK